jgi:type 2 lantibiotic biosynthesis protein LanM
MSTSLPAAGCALELLPVIARAASPEERADPSLFTPEGEAPESRLDPFIRASANGDRARFERLLAMRGTTLDDFARGLADVRCAGALPDWAEALIEVMDDFAAAEASAPLRPRPAPAEPPKGVASAVRPLLGSAERFARDTCRRLGIEVEEPAVWQVVQILAHRLFGLSADVLEAELRQASLVSIILRQPPADELPSTHASWMGRFERYPVLARLVGVSYVNWRRHVTELLERLAADRALLEETLFGGRPLGTLTAFGGDLGDVHDHGRAVAMLTFDGGRSVVYKPKDLRSAAAFVELLRHLNGRGLDPPLHTRTLIPRDGYTWDEFVPYRECESREEVGRFYHRMGMLARLLQLLNARDFWLDNLIAAGDHPVFVDFEMILQPGVSDQPSLSAAEREARRRVDDSVACIGVISFCTPIADGVQSEDLGALTPARDFLSPFRMSPSKGASLGIEPGGMRGEFMLWRKSDYAPALDGVPQRAAEWLDEIEAGYRAMHRCLAANRETLPYDELAAYPVRYIHRDTWSCMKLVQSSVRCDLLADGLAREAFLHGLLLNPSEEAGDGALRVAESEIHAFRQLDVPLFLCWPTADAVFAPDGMHAAGYFPGTAAGDLRRRAGELPRFDVDGHVALLRSCFATGAHAVREARPLAPAGSAAPAGSEEWLARAAEIGDRIARLAIRGAGDDGAWVGMVYEPSLGHHGVDVLRPDILTGTCGLALVFADLFALTGEERFRDAARVALSSVEAVARAAPALFRRTLEGAPGERRLPGCGAHNGVGGQIYALAYASRRLGLPRYGELARDYARALPLRELCAEGRIDYLSGTSGLLVSVLPLGAEAAPVVDAAAARIHAAMRGGFPREFPEYPEAATELGGLPGEVEGHALALARAGLETFPVRGTGTGALLTRLAIGDPAFDDVRAALARPPESSREALDAMELAFAAHRADGDGRWLAGAAANGAALAARGLTHSYAAEEHRLSALTGLAAVAHQFLRLHAPSRVGSIRLLEPEGNA